MTMSGPPEQPDQEQPRGRHLSRGPFGISTRWLVIGGGVTAVLLAAIAVLAVVMTGVIGGGNPQPRSILDLVPDDVDSVLITDIKGVLAIDDLADATWDEQEWESFEDNLGIDSADLFEGLAAQRGGDRLVILAGNFDLDDIRNALEDDAEEDTYRGYEVWRGADSNAALLDGYVVISEEPRPVDNALKNLYNGSGSVGKADDENEMKQILNKVGSGLVVFGATGDVCGVERCEGYGWAMTDYDPNAGESEMKIALLFRNERAAERAADDYDQVADFLERAQDIDIEDTEADGSFVVGRAVEDLDGHGDSSNTGERPQTAASVPATSQRDRWIDDCDALDLSFDRDRGINSLENREFIVIGGERRCACAYDDLLSRYDPWQPPLLSDVYHQSSQVGRDVERYFSDFLTLRDASGAPGPTIPYSGYVENLYYASNSCAAR